MNEIEIRKETVDRVAEAVRRALALVGPADSTLTERTPRDRGDQTVS